MYKLKYYAKFIIKYMQQNVYMTNHGHFSWVKKNTFKNTHVG